MPKKSMGKTGDAPIAKQGHTTDTLYGSDPNAKRRPNVTTRNLDVK